jgi:GMP synthase (glutamine-hydrolysing)
MNILCITHADFEPEGIIADWATKRGHDFTVVRPYLGDTLPMEFDGDFLIVMGGPQSPLEIEKYPY